MKKLEDSSAVVKEDLSNLDVRVALIQALIPLGLAAVEDQLQQEVAQLAGAWYARKADDQTCRRWGQQKGSVYLAEPDEVRTLVLGALRRGEIGQTKE